MKIKTASYTYLFLLLQVYLCRTSFFTLLLASPHHHLPLEPGCHSTHALPSQLLAVCFHFPPLPLLHSDSDNWKTSCWSSIQKSSLAIALNPPSIADIIAAFPPLMEFTNRSIEWRRLLLLSLSYTLWLQPVSSLPVVTPLLFWHSQNFYPSFFPRHLVLCISSNSTVLSSSFLQEVPPGSAHLLAFGHSLHLPNIFQLFLSVFLLVLNYSLSCSTDIFNSIAPLQSSLISWHSSFLVSL